MVKLYTGMHSFKIRMHAFKIKQCINFFQFVYIIKYDTHLLKPKYGSVVTNYIKHTIIMPKDY